MCAHVTQRGMTKEGDKARTQAERAGRTRKRELGERKKGGKRGGAEDENSNRKTAKKERKARMVYTDPKTRECKK